MDKTDLINSQFERFFSLFQISEEGIDAPKACTASGAKRRDPTFILIIRLATLAFQGARPALATN